MGARFILNKSAIILQLELIIYMVVDTDCTVKFSLKLTSD